MAREPCRPGSLDRQDRPRSALSSSWLVSQRPVMQQRLDPRTRRYRLPRGKSGGPTAFLIVIQHIGAGSQSARIAKADRRGALPGQRQGTGQPSLTTKGESQGANCFQVRDPPAVFAATPVSRSDRRMQSPAPPRDRLREKNRVHTKIECTQMRGFPVSGACGVQNPGSRAIVGQDPE